MTNRNVRRRLAAAIEHGHSVKLTYTERYGSTHGVPLAMSRTLVVLQDITEFHFDGWEIVPLQRIEQVRSSRFERISERLMRAEKIIPASSPPADIQYGSLEKLFESLAASTRITIVETDEPNDDGLATDHFYIGRIISTEDERVTIHHFTVTRGWNKKLTVIPFEEIMSVSFGGEYEEVWSRHLPPLPAL